MKKRRFDASDFEKWSNEQDKRRSSSKVPQENLAQQIKKTQTLKESIQARTSDAFKMYQAYLNTQMNTDQYDFLEDGGRLAEQANMERDILWQNYVKAQTDANQTQKDYDDLLDSYTTQMANAERDSYQAMEMEDLNALKEDQKTVVEQNQAAAIEAQNNYGLYMNQMMNTDDIDFLAGEAVVSEEIKAQQQALLQNAYAATEELTDSRESYHLMEDTYNYRYDSQLISEMSEPERIALELYANGLNVIENVNTVNSLTSEQRARLRETGRYWQILSDPKAYLKYMGYSGESLDRLAETYSRSRNAQRMEELQETAQSIGDSSPFWGTVSTYPVKLVGDVTGGLAAIDSGIKHTLGLSHYNGIDVNKPGYALSVYSDTVRDTVSDDFTASGKALYDGFNHVVDSVAEDAVFKGLSKLPDLKGISKAGQAAVDMLGSYGETVRDSAVSGGSTNEAIGLGLTSVGIDWLTSRISVDELLQTKSFDDWSPLAKRCLSGAVEMTQEELDYIGNLVTQTAILAEDSDFYRQVEALVQTGMSEEEAKKLIYAQYCQEVENIAVMTFLESGDE